MDLKLLLATKVLIEILMIAAILRRARTLFKRGWPMSISYLFIAGLAVSALNSIFIIFYPDSTIKTWSTISQLAWGASIIAVWELVSSLSFLHFMKTDNNKVDRLVAKISSKQGLVFIGVYSLFAIAIMIFFGLGPFKEGFAGFIGELEATAGSWQQLFIDLPAKIWYFPMGLLVINAASKSDMHKRWLYYGIAATASTFIIFSLWTLGYRGTILRAAAFFFVVFIAINLRKRTWIILIGAMIVALILMVPTAQYRAGEAVASKDILERFRGIYDISENTSAWQSLGAGIEYTVYRLSPAEPGGFAEWVEENSAYAGVNPLIGSSLGLFPRAIWAGKPATGSLSSSPYDNPAYITGRIMGTPNASRNTSQATNSFWIAWYPGVVLFAFISGWFAALLLKIGESDFMLGLLLLSITIGWGSTFLDASLERLLAMFTQAVIPAIIVMLIFKKFGRESSADAEDHTITSFE